jgi:hypothetical protein
LEVGFQRASYAHAERSLEADIKGGVQAENKKQLAASTRR